MRLFGSVFLLAVTAFARTAFWAPVVPPRAHYAIDVGFIPDPGRLEGTETIRFRNDTRQPIGRIALEWFGEILRVRANGAVATRTPGKQRVALFDLPEDVPPAGAIELSVEFTAGWKLDAGTGSAITAFVAPHLWWGFGTLDDYDVRFRAPEAYAAATSGRYDAAAGLYRAESIRAFGLFLGKGYESAEADAGDVRVRAVFTKEGRPCAELLLKTAVDVIGFYRERYGFYPHRSLAIVPGMNYPAGGYPAASALAVVHGQQHLAQKPEAHWLWITSHEIGHMYWGNYVLAEGPDSLSWLMIGLGIHADRGYKRARGIAGPAGLLEANYRSGMARGYDTTMDVTEEQESAIQWDFNNVVEHGKSIALVNALESVIGAQTFERLYRRCLHDYAGRQLGWREFQRLAEAESGQDLGWFFEQWVRSSDRAAYSVTNKECAQAGTGFDCRVEVKRDGEMQIPVTVAARFEDGSEQRASTERLADVAELDFHGNSQLKEAAIEPDAAVVLAPAPLTEVTPAADALLELYLAAQENKVDRPGDLLMLGLTLYDRRFYAQALDVMTMTEKLAAQKGNNALRFAALVWQGHLLDLLGRRAEAIARYQAALQVPGSPSIRHDQYHMVVDKPWAEERLKTAFERK